jgi:hypothetical protein
MVLFLVSLSNLTSGCEPDCYDCDFLEPECSEDVDCDGIQGGQCHGAAFCTFGQCELEPLPARTLCTANDGIFCNASGSCVECLETSDCSEELCRRGRCAPLSCGDSVLNGDETDIDCGGACGPCELGRTCEVPLDCQYLHLCISGVCAESQI